MRIVQTTLGLLSAALLMPMLGFSQSRDETRSKQESVRAKWDAMEAASPLHYALWRKNYDEALAAMPLVKDIDVVEDTTGMTALGLAAKDESADAIDMVQSLVVQFGADPTVADSEGYTALHYAARAGNLAVVQFLVTMGAEVDAEISSSRRKHTPLAMAYMSGHKRIANFLLRHGAGDFAPEVIDDFELTASMAAAAEELKSEVMNDPRGFFESDPQESARKSIQTLVGATEKTLRAQGRIEEAEAFKDYRERMLKAIESTPFEPGMSRSEYSKKVQARIAAERYGLPAP